MAEEWDDDDFGTFESADASSPTTAETVAPSSSAPAWLLVAQQKGNEKGNSKNTLLILSFV